MKVALSDKAIEARRAYQKEWRAKNRDKVKQYNCTYWEKHAKKSVHQKEK